MAATITLRVYTGTGAGTESSPQTGIALLSADSASPDPDSAEVAPGTYSYEKWIRLKIDAPDGKAFTNFWIERAGDLPDGVEIRFGVTDTPATPKATASSVATKELQANRRYVFDVAVLDEAGDATRYLVIQERVGADVDPGDIEQQVFTIGYTAGPATE